MLTSLAYAMGPNPSAGQGQGGGIGLMFGSANGAFNLNLRLTAAELRVAGREKERMRAELIRTYLERHARARGRHLERQLPAHRQRAGHPAQRQKVSTTNDPLRRVIPPAPPRR